MIHVAHKDLKETYIGSVFLYAVTSNFARQPFVGRKVLLENLT